ncbi:hypothetical protein JCM16303_007126 [Sporobolomyces ruberrimus]
MSDSSSPAPAEVTANSVISTPHPPSDSAPPPSSPSTSVALPSRNYSSGPVYVRPPPAYAPNSSVPNFIRLLATLVFLGGTVSAAVAWFYKSVVVPRLILALKAKTKLFDTHQVKYTQLWESLRRFTESKSCERLGGKEAIEFRKKQQNGTSEGNALENPEVEVRRGEAQEKDDEKEPLLQEGNEGETEPSPSLPPPPQLLVPLQDSLKSLHSSLSLSSTSIASKSASTNPSNLVQPQGQLMRSFVTFNEYLESELQSVTSTISNPYRTYGSSTVSASSSGVGGGERKALQEATQGFKAEIRSIKGALLNRRNFARPGEVGA